MLDNFYETKWFSSLFGKHFCGPAYWDIKAIKELLTRPIGDKETCL